MLFLDKQVVWATCSVWYLHYTREPSSPDFAFSVFPLPDPPGAFSEWQDKAERGYL